VELGVVGKGQRAMTYREKRSGVPNSNFKKLLLKDEEDVNTFIKMCKYQMRKEY